MEDIGKVSMVIPENVDVVLLCGGLGTRLKKVIHDRPKPMAEINHRPFLDILVDYVLNFGFRRFILCTGYKSDIIREYYQAKDTRAIFLFSEEQQALGTAGAIKNAELHIQSDVFMVMNGDSFCGLNMLDFLRYHDSKKAFVSIALVEKEKSQDCGVVRTDENGRIVSFHEKIGVEGVNLVSAGMYLFSKAVLSFMPAHKNYSLEFDLFPSLVQNEAVYGFCTNQQLIDIGTPERYELAKRIFQGTR